MNMVFEAVLYPNMSPSNGLNLDFPLIHVHMQSMSSKPFGAPMFRGKIHKTTRYCR